LAKKIGNAEVEGPAPSAEQGASTGAPGKRRAAARKAAEPASRRRFGAKTSASRARLVQAGIEVLQNEGAGAFTARRVAEQAGLKPQLVHYYFRTMEDLLLAIMQHWGAEGLRRSLAAVHADEPLREIWRVTNMERSSGLVAEVLKLAQQSETLLAEAYRQILMAEALDRHLKQSGRSTHSSGMSIIMIVDALARLLSSERAVGFSLGHEELNGLIDAWLDGYYREGRGDGTPT
jgi:TetR/AcrR family transcriptional regulator